MMLFQEVVVYDFVDNDALFRRFVFVVAVVLEAVAKEDPVAYWGEEFVGVEFMVMMLQVVLASPTGDVLFLTSVILSTRVEYVRKVGTDTSTGVEFMIKVALKVVAEGVDL
mmetsp:Transcript_703/g.971  ORF Transcript_703/g.971 Transcript_703/m.971 type:complete len:111 (-) Transcript_703:20-352(-)